MKTYYVFFVKLCVFYKFLYVSGVYGQGPIVNTTLGLVRGVLADDGEYSMFLGIPFAKVAEDNPFGLAQPHPRFDGILEANDDSAICPQEEEFNHTIVGTLDCLHLNIHVPFSASPTNLLPVFVWIFGGGFEIGFYGRFLYGPKFLVRHDIVFVTINYRLGPYGFMCLDTPEVPGNQGLKDQLIALRWIRENIAAFGGDPDKVTIAGNSAGSVSVEEQILRKSDGPLLFQKAVLQSGSTYSFGISEPSRDAPLLMAQHLGFETSDISEAIAFLTKVDPLLIIKTRLELNISFGLCIEKEFEGVEAFITQNTAEISEVPAVKNMSIMIGFNDEEALPVTQGGLDNDAKYIVFLFLSLLFDMRHPDFGFIVENVQNFYFGDEEINDDQIQAYIDFMSDLMFIHPTHRSIKRFLDNDAESMYFYMFSHAGARNFVKHRENITSGGAGHADELGYLFDISYMEEPSSQDQLVIDGMTTMWANFVKYADPTPQLSELLPYKWETITKNSSYHYMDIGRELYVGTRPLHERMTFLDLLFDAFEHLQHSTLINESDAYRLLRKVMLY